MGGSLLDQLKSMILQMKQDAEEHHLSAEEIEAVWAMGLSAYLTAKGYGLVKEATDEESE